MLSTDALGPRSGVVGVHGGVKFYRGSAAAARSYVEADRSRVDDYYLAEGTGVASRYVATTPPTAGGRGIAAVQDGGTLDGDSYERWVAGYDVEKMFEVGQSATPTKHTDLPKGMPKSTGWADGERNRVSLTSIHLVDFDQPQSSRIPKSAQLGRVVARLQCN